MKPWLLVWTLYLGGALFVFAGQAYYWVYKDRPHAPALGVLIWRAIVWPMFILTFILCMFGAVGLLASEQWNRITGRNDPNRWLP